jgi:hypothetical protein
MRQTLKRFGMYLLVSPIHARTGRRINHGAEIFLYASCLGMLASGGRLARRCAQLAVGRQPAADRLRKRSLTGTRRKSRVRKPGFCVVRPAGRVHLEVKVLYEPGRGNR